MKREIKVNLVDTMELSINEFMKRIPNLGLKTRKGYTKIICSFLLFLETHKAGKEFPAKIKRQTFVDWIKYMELRYTIITIQSHARIIARFLKFLGETEVLKHNSVGVLQKLYPKSGMAGITSALLGCSSQQSLQALKRIEKFNSPLGNSMEQFISLGRSQGKRYQNEEEILSRFDQFITSLPEAPLYLSDSILMKWINQSRASLYSTRQLNFVVVRRFCLYQRRFDPSAYVPDASFVEFKSPALIPYVYTRTQIIAFLNTARELRSSNLSPIRPQMYYFLFLLLYTTGMRISEALALEIRDIDKNGQTFHIREGKFFKSRLVPMSGSVAKELEIFLVCRQTAGLSNNDKSPLFQNPHRVGHLSKSVVTTTFSGILRQLDVGTIAGRRSPCIHSFRHTMAVHRLEDWYRQGANVQSKLHLLSTYLGHVKIASTQQYLTMTTELLQQASNRFNLYFVIGQTGEEQ